MNKQEYNRRFDAFWKCWVDIHASLGFNAPDANDRRTTVAWEKVQNFIEPEAYPFIAEVLGDGDNKPRNLKKAMMAVYYQWREKQQAERPASEAMDGQRGKFCDGPICRQIAALGKEGVKGMEAIKIAVETERSKRYQQ